MLILGRRPKESLRIGDDVVVTVLSVKGNQIRLGITAPKHVVVDREEVHQRKLAEYAPVAGLRDDQTAIEYSLSTNPLG